MPPNAPRGYGLVSIPVTRGLLNVMLFPDYI